MSATCRAHGAFSCADFPTSAACRACGDDQRLSGTSVMRTSATDPAAPSTARIRLYDAIGYGWFGVTAKDFVAELDGLGPDALRQARRQKYLDMGSRSLAG